ncbi:beta-N-acetylhexosaminidase [Tamlana nanhaiensis]|uniref:beta-N-acetylhexosaminidase n=1 Tax=Neotamlana nanhaiensis TaxID=1382798 RepID=A0A0D7VZZ3_9FLAO|nr:family 20 glycosylhydrolase [Tamlana nanhaiensis]KJD31177.1 beta-N-acetylhexosaminidase [Tamlana nanhaiensis]
MNRLKYIISCLLIALCFACKEDKVFTEADINIIPKPKALQLNKGSFEFNDNTVFVVSTEAQKTICNSFINQFKTATGISLSIVNEAPSNNFIALKTDDSLAAEAYTLNANNTNVNISASSDAGFIYGLETLLQLLPTEIESTEVVTNIEWIIPAVSITDEPRFKHRGLMLDLSRHFFEKSYIKQTIDRLVKHKMNVLHLHLVDDQGWRIEIKKHPKLTEVGAWRVNQEDAAWNARTTNSPDEKGTYGGFLTQADLREIVAYAEEKNIEVIPEIEMPAHVSSAIAAYPELSCFEKPIGVPSGGVWPITDIYCAGKDSTFEFLEDVLLEVMAIFPSEYIHIGGDEATKTNWEVCPHCQKRIKTEGLESVEELQSYFVKRMEKFINSKGKKLIGWDEILEGGLSPKATVMSWRGTKGGIEAAKQGHDVIMTPEAYCYFNFYQGPQNEEPTAFNAYLPLNKVYEFNPVPEEFTEDQAQHILGAQANLWAEFIASDDASEYMMFPRLAALSEVLWSPQDQRNWEDFSKRLFTQFKRYDYAGINYAKSAYLVTASAKADIENNSVKLALKNEFPNPDIRYVFNDDSIENNATKYTDTLTINETTIVKASLFKDNKPVGKTYVDTIKFHKASGSKISFAHPYHDNYQADGIQGLVNSIRGSKNFHDGQWQAWIGNPMEATITLDNITEIESVSVGLLENQGAGIYFPEMVEVLLSSDGKTFEKVGEVKSTLSKSTGALLKDLKITFNKSEVKFIKVIAKPHDAGFKGNNTFVFVDEIIVE